MKDKEIHILLISSWYPNKKQPFLGNFIQRKAELLAAKYKVTVINTISDSEIENTELSKNKTGNLSEITILHPRGKHIFKRRRNQNKALNLAFKEIQNVDLIIGSILLPKGLQFLKAKRHFKCPLIYTEHGSYFRSEVSASWTQIYRLIWKKVSFNVDAVVAVSEFLKKDLQPFFPKSDIEVIGNHVNVDLFEEVKKPENSRAEFLHVSTLDFQTKNPEGIFEACAKLKEKSDNFNLTIICDEDVTEWKELVSTLNLEENITFLGPLKWEDIVPYYQKADAFILFSIYETFSIVLLEAWLTGTPTISTEVGIADKLPSTIGLLVAQNNTEQLAKKMLGFIQKEYNFDAKTIRNYGLQYSQKEILSKWTKLINSHVK